MLKTNSRGQAVDTNYSWMISSDSRAEEESQLVFKVLHLAPGKFGTGTSVILCQKEKNPTCHERAALTAASAVCTPHTLKYLWRYSVYDSVIKTTRHYRRSLWCFKIQIFPQLDGCNWISDFPGRDGAFVSGIGVKCHSFSTEHAALFLMLTEKEKIANVS